MRIGVNLSGAEWGEDHLPGVLGQDYVFPSERSLQYWAEQGLTRLRVPFRWERLQPTPGGPLDEPYLEQLVLAADRAAAAGLQLAFEPHNFGRYRIEGTDWIIDQSDGRGRTPVSRYDLADLWVRFAHELGGHRAVWAYDLMNEPHDMGGSDWKRISQCVVVAIRAAGDTKLILVPGDGWSGSEWWKQRNGRRAWIDDPAGNILYEAHCYFDGNRGGRYELSYDEEAAKDGDLATVGRRRVTPFLDWCRDNGVGGIVGEFGVPHADPRWLPVMDGFLDAVAEAGMDAFYWAAGEWWQDYAIGIQPSPDYAVHRPQLARLKGQMSGGLEES
ncbi:glycoside hydrolase family 5 protein [Paludibaculum fermentans]|uniref:Cellulase family glycosylhydrolase n=1 Tax=Paludibaculum fermentans TaxID=1473598 RepID=A0A7S7NQB7_PALFE|nr:cellulase family glycosylhydrolase [Paludibaculum fermentans]QOY87754.1 cellulase family glycosylhydrolase [Paludibaculum fermentans]